MELHRDDAVVARMQPMQPAPTLSLTALATAHAADLANIYGGEASAAARAGLRMANMHGYVEAIELWSAVCAIFDGRSRANL